MEQQQVTAQISHLIRILVDNLQQDPFAPIREYISNSHDATLSVSDPLIQIWGEGNRLYIKDNGCGMSRQVILEAFTRIAGHLKQAEELNTIGMFGIGVLSAFIVAERLEVQTRSEKEDHGWHLVWKRYADNFSLEPIDLKERGTIVTMYLDDFSYDLANNTEIEGYINRTFALFDTSIYGVNKNNEPINKHAQWMNALNTKAGEGQLLEGNEFRRLMDNYSRHDLMAGYVAEMDGGTRIFLGIPARETSPIVQKDEVTFCSKGIYVHGNISAFFPKNLSFMVGIVDSPDFKLQITREEIFLQDAYFEKVKKSVEFHILRFLKLMAKQDGTLVEQILRTHRVKLMAHAHKSPQLCNLFKQNYSFETSAGSLRWREMLPFAESNGKQKTIYISSSEIDIWDQVTSVSNRGFLTIYAPGVEHLILQEIAKKDGVELRDSALIRKNGAVTDVPEPFRKLGNMISGPLGRKGIGAVVFVNEPGKPPTMFRIQTARGEHMFPHGGSDLPNKNYTVEGVMLNIAHPLISRLAGKKNLSRKVYEKIAEILYQIAVLHSPFNDLWLSSKEDIMANLIESLELRIGLKKAGDYIDGAADCFIALPYKEAYSVVWEVIEAVLSAAPYNWKVIRADRQIRNSALLDNIINLIKTSQRFLADISGLNANVLIEVGLMIENDPAGILIICDEETYGRLPADLQGKLLLVYPNELRSNPENFADFISEKIKAYTEWISMAGKAPTISPREKIL